MKKTKTNTKKTSKKKETIKKETIKKEKKTQARYEGVVEYNLKTLKEATQSGKAFQRWSYLIILLLITFEQIYFMIGDRSSISISLPIVSILICLYSILMDFSKRDYYHQIKYNAGQTVRQKVEFHDDKIVLINLDFKNRVSFQYSDVKKMYETKNLLAIILKYNTGLTVEKKSLNKKTKELEDFIYKQQNLEPKRVKKVWIFSPYVFVGFLIINIILLVLSIVL